MEKDNIEDVSQSKRQQQEQRQQHNERQYKHPEHTINNELEKAGDELLDALDDAFAEFADEDFDLDTDIDADSDSVYLDTVAANSNEDSDGDRDGGDCDHYYDPAEKFNGSGFGNGNVNDDDRIDVSDSIAIAATCNGVHTNDKFLSSTHASSIGDEEIHVNDQAMVDINSKNDESLPEFSCDENLPEFRYIESANDNNDSIENSNNAITTTGTDEELEEELEKRVSEWIENADLDSDTDLNSIQEEKKEISHSPQTPPATTKKEIEMGEREDAGAESISHSLPQNIDTLRFAGIVSPLMVREIDFTRDARVGDEREGDVATEHKDQKDRGGICDVDADNTERVENSINTDNEFDRNDDENENDRAHGYSHAEFTSPSDLGGYYRHTELESIPESDNSIEEQLLGDEINFSYTSDSGVGEVGLELNGSHSSKIYVNTTGPNVEDGTCSVANEDDKVQSEDKWDFDDVDSLPTCSENDALAVSDSEVGVESSIAETEEFFPVEKRDDKGNHQSSTCNVVNSEQNGWDIKQQTQSDASPSPNDVTSIEELPFFKTQQLRTEELAQSNAEDVLALSLEVQNLKALLKEAKESNQIAVEEMNQEKLARLKVEEDLQRRRREHADAQNTYCDDIQELMTQCQHAKVKIQSAEQDAEEALELAEENAQNRAEMEGFLQRALDELEQLRSHAQPLPIIVEDSMHNDINTEDDLSHTPSTLSTPTRYSCSPRRIDRRKVGVCAGRSLLRQAVDNDELSFASTQDGSTGSTNTDSNSYYITLSRRSAERRQRLISRLKMASDEGSAYKDVVVFSSSDRDGLDLNYTNTLNKSVKSIVSVIRKSGKTLGLGGRWFSKRQSGNAKPKEGDEVDMETMTKSYCKSVETIIAKHKKELKDLKSFCDYLEGKVAEVS